MLGQGGFGRVIEVTRHLLTLTLTLTLTRDRGDACPLTLTLTLTLTRARGDACGHGRPFRDEGDPQAWQLERQHQSLGAKPPPLHIDLELDDAIDLVKDAFVSAGERDIKTGDTVEICIITSAGVRIESHPLNID